MIIALIGMSGVGKSTWSARLRAAGFRVFICDELIAARLRGHYGEPVGAPGELGQWLGLPEAPGYPEREARYLRCEGEVLEAVLDEVEGQGPAGPPVLVDTGGSVIYCPEATLARLRRSALVAYLALAPESYPQMLERYLVDPAPLLWQGHFLPAPGEARQATYARCYPALIASRVRRYEAICHVEVPFPVHRSPALTAEGLVSYISRAAGSARPPADEPAPLL